LITAQILHVHYLSCACKYLYCVYGNIGKRMSSIRLDALLVGRDASPTTFCSSVSQKKPLIPIHSFLSLLFNSLACYLRAQNLGTALPGVTRRRFRDAALGCWPYQARCARRSAVGPTRSSVRLPSPSHAAAVSQPRR
jgi:hypothetical protein